MAVQSASSVQGAFDSIHWPIYLIARAVAIWVVVGDRILISPLPQFRCHLHYVCFPLLAFKPCFEKVHSLMEILRTAGEVNFPYSFVQLELLEAPISYFQKSMQKTKYDGYCGE